jgi:cob(I)alamin adenosyltransferase
MKGYIQVYTGNGKGKTTAALGLALRAVGAGKKVYFAQFVKGKIYSEIAAINRYIPEITVKQYGRGCFIVNEPTSEDIHAAQEGLEEVRAVIRSGQYDVVVLDEATIALHYKLFSTEELIAVLEEKPEEPEIVSTGRNAPTE